jgi:hypothetical protein
MLLSCSTNGIKRKLETIAGVIRRLQRADGLTWARDDYHVKYLMDNSEVYRGLRAMARLEAQVFGDRKAARRYAVAARRVRHGIFQSLFDESTGLYYVAKFEGGNTQPANLNQWYPGTVAIAWPHLFGVTAGDSDIAQAQMAALNDSWDGDSNPDWTTTIVDSSQFLWPSVGYAALLAGDCERARRHANFVKGSKFPNEDDPTGFAWPFVVDDGGWLLRTLSRRAPAE